MLTPSSIDFPYTALIYTNEPPAQEAFLIPIDLKSVDLPCADPCSVDFPYTAFIYTNEPLAQEAFLIPIDLYNMDLHYADPCSFPSVFSVSCFPSPVFRLLCFALCAISKNMYALRALQIFSGSGFPKQGNWV